MENVYFLFQNEYFIQREVKIYPYLKYIFLKLYMIILIQSTKEPVVTVCTIFRE